MSNPMCKVCNTKMVKSNVIYNDTPTMSTRDFSDSTIESRGQTLTNVSSGKRVNCMMCPNCGHSFIPTNIPIQESIVTYTHKSVAMQFIVANISTVNVNQFIANLGECNFKLVSVVPKPTDNHIGYRITCTDSSIYRFESSELVMVLEEIADAHKTVHTIEPITEI